MMTMMMMMMMMINIVYAWYHCICICVYMVRSTLLWPQVVAAPKGEIRGGYGPCGPGTWFSAFFIMKKSRAEICQPRAQYFKECRFRMVRSTLLRHGAKHSPLASAPSRPEGGNRGGHRDLWQGHGFSHFSCRKNQEPGFSHMVPDTSRCVDSESAIDFSLFFHVMLS